VLRRVALVPLAVLAAILLQLTLLDNLPFPGGSAPDLVLVLVVALALASGPRNGMLIGFGAGLALDIAPPATHLLGLNALAFTLVGYGCGRMRGPLERSAWLPLAAVALGAAAGEAVYALVGLTFGDPDITVASIRQVLPVSIVYDILLSPFVLYAVVSLARLGGLAARRAADPGQLTGREQAASWLAGSVAAADGAVRDTRSGREPHLRTAASRQADGWIGGSQRGPGQPAGAWAQRQPPRLRIRGGTAGSAAGDRAGRGLPGLARPISLRFSAPRRRDGVVGGSLLSPGSGGLGGWPGGWPGARGLTGRSSRGGGLRGAAFRGAPGGSASGSGAGSPGRALRPVAPPRLRARAFRGAPGGGGTASRPGSSPPPARPRRPGGRKLRARMFRGGASALAGPGGGKTGRPVRLHLGGKRRRDGVVGGGVLGSGTSVARGAGTGSGGRVVPGAAFRGGRAPSAPGPLRAGHGQGAAPRFRRGRRALLRRRGDALGGRRGMLPGGGSGLSGGRGGLGGRRGAFGSRRGLGGQWLRLGGPRRRTGFWRMGSKRTGGLP
jgi:rod shape-determining protein MreD